MGSIALFHVHVRAQKRNVPEADLRGSDPGVRKCLFFSHGL